MEDNNISPWQNEDHHQNSQSPQYNRNMIGMLPPLFDYQMNPKETKNKYQMAKTHTPISKFNEEKKNGLNQEEKEQMMLRKKGQSTTLYQATKNDKQKFQFEFKNFKSLHEVRKPYNTANKLEVQLVTNIQPKQTKLNKKNGLNDKQLLNSRLQRIKSKMSISTMQTVYNSSTNKMKIFKQCKQESYIDYNKKNHQQFNLTKQTQYKKLFKVKKQKQSLFMKAILKNNLNIQQTTYEQNRQSKERMFQFGRSWENDGDKENKVESKMRSQRNSQEIMKNGVDGMFVNDILLKKQQIFRRKIIPKLNQLYYQEQQKFGDICYNSIKNTTKKHQQQNTDSKLQFQPPQIKSSKRLNSLLVSKISKKLQKQNNQPKDYQQNAVENLKIKNKILFNELEKYNLFGLSNLSKVLETQKKKRKSKHQQGQNVNL